MSKEFKIEAGKYYESDNGKKFYVCATNKPGVYPVIGWFEDGMIAMYPPNTSHLVSEWAEPERIPWEHLPKWCKWWAKDGNGTESGFELKPTLVSSCWAGSEVGGAVYLPPKFQSNYTGDWRQSLRERPEGV